MEKIYELEMFGEVHKIILAKTSYRSNNTLAILMIEVFDDGHEEDWSTLTVNIDDSNMWADKNRFAFIDVNNNGNEIIPWLRANNIAVVDGYIGFSGFCAYPLVCFTSSALKDMRSL